MRLAAHHPRSGEIAEIYAVIGPEFAPALGQRTLPSSSPDQSSSPRSARRTVGAAFGSCRSLQAHSKRPRLQRKRRVNSARLWCASATAVGRPSPDADPVVARPPNVGLGSSAAVATMSALGRVMAGQRTLKRARECWCAVFPAERPSRWVNAFLTRSSSTLPVPPAIVQLRRAAPLLQASCRS